MPAPSEAVRETALRLLADPATGLNPAFIANCQRRQIAVPVPGDAGSDIAPFDFGPNSATVFRMREDIDWLGRNSNQQYPCLVAYAASARQDRQGQRPYGAKFFGVVTVTITIYIAWLVGQTPDNNDFETHLDALEESLIAVLNADSTAWVPVLYANNLDIVARLPLQECNNSQAVRRGIQVEITATVSA